MSKIKNKFLDVMPANTVKGNNTGSSANPQDIATTGTGNVVLATAPTLTNPVVGTQSQGDSSTKGASTAYVDVAVANAVAGVNPAIAVNAATTAASDTSGFTYNNGVSGIGATFTGATNTAITIDGFTFTTLGQRLLVKNDTQSPSGAFNGIYYVTQVQTSLLPAILTRALDFDSPSDMNNTGAIPVINGTINGTTSWVLSSLVVTVGTTPLTFTIFTKNPASYLLAANNLSDVASKSASFNNISPMTTGGDIIYGGTSGAGTRLPNGSAGQVLTSNGGTSAPSWQASGGTPPVWTSFTVVDAVNGSFSAGAQQAFYLQETHVVKLRVNVVVNSPAASIMTIQLPNSLTVNSSFTATIVTGWGGVNTGANNGTTISILATANNAYITFGYIAGGNVGANQTASTLFLSGGTFTFEAEVPI